MGQVSETPEVREEREGGEGGREERKGGREGGREGEREERGGEIKRHSSLWESYVGHLYHVRCAYAMLSDNMSSC